MPVTNSQHPSGFIRLVMMGPQMMSGGYSSDVAHMELDSGSTKLSWSESLSATASMMMTIHVICGLLNIISHVHCDCDGCILIFFENFFSGITWRVFLVAQPSFVWRRTFGRVGTQQLLHGVRQRKIWAECVELLDCCRHLRGPLPVLFCPVQDEQSIKLWDVLDAVDDGMWLKACGPLSSSSVEVHEIQVLSEKKRDFDFWTQFCHFCSIFRFWDTVRSKNKIQTQIFFLSH